MTRAIGFPFPLALFVAAAAAQTPLVTVNGEAKQSDGSLLAERVTIGKDGYRPLQ